MPEQVAGWSKSRKCPILPEGALALSELPNVQSCEMPGAVGVKEVIEMKELMRGLSTLLKV